MKTPKNHIVVLAVVLGLEVGCNTSAPPSSPATSGTATSTTSVSPGPSAKAMTEEQAVAELTKIGAKINHENGKYLVDIRNTSEFTDAEMDLLEKLPNIVDLYLENVPVSDDGLPKLVSQPHIGRLVLNDCDISGKGLRTLSQLPLHLGLYDLSLRKARITDEDAKLLAEFPRLSCINVGETLMTDNIIPILSKLPLNILYRKNSKLTEEGIAELKKVRPNLDVRPNSNDPNAK